MRLDLRLTFIICCDLLHFRIIMCLRTKLNGDMLEGLFCLRELGTEGPQPKMVVWARLRLRY